MISTGYFWYHIPTKKQGLSLFTTTHALEGRTVWKDGIPLTIALELVNKWNAAPDWKYWI